MHGRGSPLVRFAAFALLAIVVPALILAILGYHSLRQWRRSADELFREQSRSMAVMVAMIVRKGMYRRTLSQLSQL